MEYTKGEQCSARVYDSSGFGLFNRCQKQAVLERDGKPYCKIHDPEYIEAKRKAKSAKWEAEWKTKRSYRELQSTAVEACKHINPDNPMAAAESITALYEACQVALKLLKEQYEILLGSYPNYGKLLEMEKLELALAKAVVK